MTSPARAGSTLVAAKPTAVARNALAKLVGTERLEQVLPTPRANREIREHRQQRQRQPLGARVHDLAGDATQVDVVQKQAPATPTASARTINVRKCDRMKDRNVSTIPL